MISRLFIMLAYFFTPPHQVLLDQVLIAGGSENPPNQTLGSGESAEQKSEVAPILTNQDGVEENVAQKVLITEEDGEQNLPDGSEGALTPPNQPVPDQVLVALR